MKYEIKVIRDYALGDGYLVQPCGQNGGSGFRCTHGVPQKSWLDHKQSVFEGLGFNVTRQEYMNVTLNYQMYTQTTQEFRPFYDRWYHMGPNGKNMKNLVQMLADAPFDMNSFMIMYLDNGHSEVRKTRIQYKTKQKVAVEPFFDNLSLCCPYQDATALAARISALGFECKPVRSFELRSRVTIYRVEHKERMVKCLRDFCTAHGLEKTFAYKYDLPVRCRPERLSEGTSISDGRGCDSLISTDNKQKVERVIRSGCPATLSFDPKAVLSK